MLAHPPVHALNYFLDMLLKSTEVNIQFVEMFQECSEGSAFGHLGKGIHIFRESSWYKFGKLALDKAGNDELLRNDIINAYLDMGITLEDK